MRIIGWTIVGFTLFGFLLAGIFGPDMIVWYFTPPADPAFNCKPSLEWGIHTYRKTVLFAGAGGAVMGLIVGALLAKRKPGPTPPRP